MYFSSSIFNKYPIKNAISSTSQTDRFCSLKCKMLSLINTLDLQSIHLEKEIAVFNEKQTFIALQHIYAQFFYCFSVDQ